MKIRAFDFDGTLTRKDTLIAFILFAKGYCKTIIGFALFSPLIVLMKLKCYPNWKAKQKVFSWFFKGMKIDEFDDLCTSFANQHKHILRKEGIKCIHNAIANQEKVIVITASIEHWVRPFFASFQDNIAIEGTKIEVKDGKITGKFLSKNCYGAEKVNRLKKVFPNRSTYQLAAYGDSRGDYELLKEADEKHFKPFRVSTSKTKGEILRFLLVGTIATAIQYISYLLLLKWSIPLVANSIAYIISFIFNYIASTYFTFKVSASTKKGVGFGIAHLVNYALQSGFLYLFLYFGVSKAYAMIPVFACCVPINFILVRFFLKKL